MAQENAERVVLRKIRDSDSWEEIGRTKTATPDEAIDQLTKVANGQAGNEPGVYRAVPARYWGDEVEIVTEQKVVTSFIKRPADGTASKPPAAPPSAPEKDDD
jgi:hypothetical protein